jgi:hypothetical protein
MTQNLTSVLTQKTQTESASDQFVRMVQEYALANQVSPGTALTQSSHRGVMIPWIESQGIPLPPAVDFTKFRKDPDIMDRLPVWQSSAPPRPQVRVDDISSTLQGIEVPTMVPTGPMDVPAGVSWLTPDIDLSPMEWEGVQFAVPVRSHQAMAQFEGKNLSVDVLEADPARVARELRLSLGECVVQTVGGRPVMLNKGSVYAVPVLARITVQAGKMLPSTEELLGRTRGVTQVQVQKVYYDPMLIRLDVSILNARFMDHFGQESEGIKRMVDLFNRNNIAVVHASIVAMAHAVSGEAMIDYLAHLLNNRKRIVIHRSIHDSVRVLAGSGEMLMRNVQTLLDDLWHEAIASGYCPLSVEEIMFVIDAMNAYFDGIDDTANFTGHPTRLAELVAQMRNDLRGG